jgi:hypothetical protein
MFTGKKNFNITIGVTSLQTLGAIRSYFIRIKSQTFFLRLEGTQVKI